MTPTPAAEAVQYASDVTLADVDAMWAFLEKRTSDLSLRHDSDPAERRIAQALNTAVFDHFYAAQKIFDVDDGSAEMLGARQQRWNELCRILAPWRDTEGYDTARWRQVRHCDERQASEMAAYEAKRKAEMAAYYRERL
ncbi:hypothetical protein [Streptomyces sp. NPDC058240]|uniref:hypothetical protein n=1 Tax=Streptomyces sp. NPDC058240 TaxID=3346396 RepID=UPI0036DFBA63